ncbi:hypothetical protein [Sulfitobacter dubius]|uniref:hypothetical protein n=1 Tax=Sulfitobacter dubius TaxID=218673 RepID=UPI0022AFCB07|nr:hypothetical protein [Sulfitobacter dubius]MCZ4367536.1 hypothetical protein [Sulfitobacter dubius]
MALTVSETLQRRKQQKFKREISRVLSSRSAARLNGFLDSMFQSYSFKPTADQFVRMALASKFGVGNSVAEGGALFLLETCLQAFNTTLTTKKFSEADLHPGGSYFHGIYDTSELWSASFLFELDAKIWPHATEVGVEEFFWADNISPYLFLDNATQAYGFLIVPQPSMTLEEYREYGRSYMTNWDAKVDKQFEKPRATGLKFSDFDTGPMNYISVVQIVFGTIDKLINSLPDRDQHSVAHHSRRLSSGKVTSVRAHKRNNPLRLIVNNHVLTDHIVYCVKDFEGKIRYFGEGKRNRWQHVNSGVSHNWEINKHYFTKGELHVQIVQEGLTKSEALSIEKFLIKRNSNSGLWNVKGNEPFNVVSDQMVTDHEIQGFLKH